MKEIEHKEMFYMKRDIKQMEKDYAFQKKGKKYKTKYFGALKQLCEKLSESPNGEIEHDKDCQVSKEMYKK